MNHISSLQSVYVPAYNPLILILYCTATTNEYTEKFKALKGFHGHVFWMGLPYNRYETESFISFHLCITTNQLDKHFLMLMRINIHF